MKTKAVGYIRVSSEEQAREGLSLQVQREKIQAYCLLKDLELIETLEDAGISAKNLKRPGVQRVLEFLQEGKAQALVTYKLDRLTRSTRDLLSLVYDLFLPQELQLHSICEELNTESSNGRFFLTMLGAMSCWERELASERTAEAIRYKQSNGEWCSKPPLGFKIEGKKLVEDPQEMALIKTAKRMRRSGKTLKEISERVELPISSVHRLLKTNLRSAKAKYLNGKSA